MKSDKDIQKVGALKDINVKISPQHIEITRQGKPVSGTSLIGHVYLVIDCSASMQGNKLKQAKKGALSFAKDALAKGYLTGLIRFDSSAKLVCEPSRDISILEKRLLTLEIGDTTHMAKAINLAHELLKDIPGNRVIVIVTDGMPNGPGDPESTLKAGENAKKNGIDIIAIGTDDADQEFLKRLASRTDLGVKVSSKQFEKAISDSAKMLPPGDKAIINR